MKKRVIGDEVEESVEVSESRSGVSSKRVGNRSRSMDAVVHGVHGFCCVELNDRRTRGFRSVHHVTTQKGSSVDFADEVVRSRRGQAQS